MSSYNDILELISNPDLLPQRSRFYGPMFGVVEDIHDPLMLGRIKVRVPNYINYSVELLPWATYSSPGNGGSANVGFYFLPPVGSTVLVQFLGGNPEFPCWMGGVPGNPDEVAETHVSTLDKSAPYGQSVDPSQLINFDVDPIWDYTQFNSINTPSGHRIVLDDNHPEDSSGSHIDYRRILIESNSGNFFRIIEDKNLELDSREPLIEVGTVRDDRSWIRRLAMDHELQNITITGPDTLDVGIHEFEINSVYDFMRMQTNNGYTFIMDDKNVKIDLFITDQFTGEPQARFSMDNTDRKTEYVSHDQEYSLVMYPENSSGSYGGYMAMTYPYNTTGYPYNATSSISLINRWPSNKPSIVLAASELEGNQRNGIIIETGHNSVPQSITIYGDIGGPGEYPSEFNGDIIQLITKPNSSTTQKGDITIGRPNANHFIKLSPESGSIQATSTATIGLSAQSSILIGSPSVTITSSSGSSSSSSTIDVGTSSIKLSSQSIMMEGPQVHDYFQHYHEIHLGDIHPITGLPNQLSCYFAPLLTAFPVYQGDVGTVSSNPTNNPLNPLVSRTPLPLA